MPHTIRTDRLLLRPPVQADARAFTAACNDFDIVKMTSSWPAAFDEDFVRARFRNALVNMNSVTEQMFVIVWQGLAAGAIGLHPAVPGTAILGYMLGKPAWGQGLATEAVRAMCRHGFAAMGLARIEAEHYADNPASGRVLEKAGFRRLGPAGPAWSQARDKAVPVWRYDLTRERLRP